MGDELDPDGAFGRWRPAARRATLWSHNDGALAPWKEDLMGIEFLASGLPLATLTVLGKSIGFGLAIGLAAFGTAIGIGLVFSSMLHAAARQPEARQDLQPIMWLGFALTEAVVFYGLVGAMLLVFLI
jgi:F-type H+-transporting ATPase subunit c